MTGAVLVASVAIASAAIADEELRFSEHTTAIAYQRKHTEGKLAAWRKRVPKVNVVRIKSSVDGSSQAALWYDSGSSRPKPLLVVLHSWGASYEQNVDIPLAELAIANDWAFVHPDFRGPNLRPQATGSDLAIQDVVDAVAFARGRATIDETRVYAVGYSGGGMMAMLLAARHPDVFAAVASWGGIYDIPDWYHHPGKKAHYRKEIAASCGGAPRPGSSAEAQCKARSPSSQVARAAGRIPVLIAHGLRDTTVPPRHAVSAYDVLAAPEDRFTDAQRQALDAGQVPEDLRQLGVSDPLYDGAGAAVRLQRRSQQVTLVLFEGDHDMLYNPTLRWLAEQRRSDSQLTADR